MPLIHLKTPATSALYEKQIAAIVKSMAKHLGKSEGAIRSLVEHDTGFENNILATYGLQVDDATSLENFANAVRDETGIEFSASDYIGFSPTRWFQGDMPILEFKSGKKYDAKGRFPAKEYRRIIPAKPTFLCNIAEDLDDSRAQTIATLLATLAIDYAVDNDPPTGVKTIISGNASKSEIGIFLLDTVPRKHAEELRNAIGESLSRLLDDEVTIRIIRLSGNQLFHGVMPESKDV